MNPFGNMSTCLLLGLVLFIGTGVARASDVQKEEPMTKEKINELIKDPKVAAYAKHELARTFIEDCRTFVAGQDNPQLLMPAPQSWHTCFHVVMTIKQFALNTGPVRFPVSGMSICMSGDANPVAIARAAVALVAKSPEFLDSFDSEQLVIAAAANLFPCNAQSLTAPHASPPVAQPKDAAPPSKH